MMTDLFSSFDPTIMAEPNKMKSWLSYALWTANLIPIMILQTYWTSPNRIASILSLPMTIMTDQMSRTTGKSLKGMTTLVTPLFVFLILTNWTGLIPYVHPSSSHLLFTLSFGLPMWLAMIISSMTKNLKSFTAALLPEGAPDWLNPFLVLAETISISVRPATLSFRLAANMSAGHIVLALIGSYAVALMLTGISLTFMMVLPIHMGYMMFELAMGAIQAFIFCLLLSLYSNEHSL